MMIMVPTKRMLLVIQSLHLVLLSLSSIQATNDVEHPHQHQHNQSSTTIQCPEEERRALLDFKAGIIDPEDRLSSWSGKHCCSWAGVGCDNHTGHVDRLDLSSYQDGLERPSLGGVLRPSLASLTHLKHLDLSGNNFGQSPIPEFLGSFKQLLSLNLSWSGGFYGVIPHHLGNLSTLQWLGLASISCRVDDAGWLSGLVNLQHLDMSLVDFSGSSNLLHSFNTLSSLQELRLSRCYGISPFWPLSASNANLTNLRILDLSYNSITCKNIPSWLLNSSTLQWLGLAGISCRVDDAGWLSGLVNLQHLDMSLVDFSGSSNLLHSFNTLSSLQELRLSSCYGISPFLALSASNANLTNLRILDLSSNSFTAKNIPSWLFNSSNLEELDLSGNTFDEVANAPLGNLASLETLGLDVIDGFPETLANLCRLETLSSTYSFSINLADAERSFSGCIQHSLKSLNLQLQSNDSDRIYRTMPHWLFGLTGLEDIDLVNNKFQGPLPNAIGKLTSLRVLLLFGNYLEGGIPATIGNLGNLRTLKLGGNSLNGTVPESLGRLSKLTDLVLSANSLSGVLSEAHFAELRALKYLDLHGNSLVWNLSSTWTPPFKLEILDLSSCTLGPQFPPWIRMQAPLRLLSLSGTGIAGSLSDLLLHNNWTSELLLYLDLSRNQLSGAIPSSLCELQILYSLDVSENNLSGEIPDCWNSSSYLHDFDASYNNLSGEIPNSLVSHFNLQSLYLRKNNLSGQLPPSFSKAKRLAIIDLSYNKFSGPIPSLFGESFSGLQFLSLRGNLFMGELPSQLARLVSLQVLDLALNNFSGTIPPNFGNLSSMKSNDGLLNKTIIFGGWRDVIYLVTKRREDGYGSLLSLQVMMDLSQNNLSGEIPEELATLLALTSLNLSGNHLTGGITNKVGEMKRLESLDLSRNNLSGVIPPNLAKLDSLGSLDLSHNNLSGRIPSSNHMDTFSSSSFQGNPYLCGNPLPNKCPGDELAPASTRTTPHGDGNDEDDDDESFWLYIGIGPGFVVGFWIVWGVLILKRQWRIMYFRFADDVSDQIYVKVVIYSRRLKHKMST